MLASPQFQYADIGYPRRHVSAPGAVLLRSPSQARSLARSTVIECPAGLHRARYHQRHYRRLHRALNSCAEKFLRAGANLHLGSSDFQHSPTRARQRSRQILAKSRNAVVAHALNMEHDRCQYLPEAAQVLS